MQTINSKILIPCISIFTIYGCANSFNTPPTISTTNITGKYTIVDTNQIECYNNYGSQISCKNSGQDGEFHINMPNLTKNTNGTVKDNITGLTWQQSSDTNKDGTINAYDKMSYSHALSYCSNLKLGGFNDWRLPDIKTLYSLIDFSGEDINPRARFSSKLNPFINNNIFDMAYGDTSNGERIIDAQWATSTKYVSTTMHGNETMFGVNFADERIKGYPRKTRRGIKKFYVQCVRGNENYGKNNFIDNNNGTIKDVATNLLWEKYDSQKALTFDNAIKYCKTATTAGFTDWRVPNAKELHSIVDYSRSPDTTNSPALNRNYFQATSIINEAGKKDWGAYWSNTTHKNKRSNIKGVYINFGKSLGYFHRQWMDVHGAGAQRSDPKDLRRRMGKAIRQVKDNNGNYVMILGPQGDVIRGKNFVRCVR